jgi:hypothetical protein
LTGAAERSPTNSLRLKLAESPAAKPLALARRDVRLPGIPGKAFAVTGVRRGGKTSFVAGARPTACQRAAPAGRSLSS